MNPVYKTIKTVWPHCPVCREALSGDESMMRPWRCKCGRWELVQKENGEYDYKIIPAGDEK